MAGRPIPLKTRFWPKVDKGDGTGCWLWTGAASGRNRYGYVGVGKSAKRAHRVAYELTRGPIPAGMVVCHKCDTPRCVRPDHLFLGTPSDNTQDMIAKGRARGGGLAGDDSPCSKLTSHDVTRARALHDEGFTCKDIADRFKVGRTTISAIIHRRTWAHV